MLRQDLERACQYWRNELLNIRDILHLQTFTNFLQEQIDSILQTINRRKDKLTEETKRQEKCRDDSEKSLEMLHKLKPDHMLPPERNQFINVIEIHKETKRKEMEVCQLRIKEILEELNEIARLKREMQDQLTTIQQQADGMRPNLPFDIDNVQQQQGLSPARIQQFEQFAANQPMDRGCGSCLADIEVGTRMMRLDCDGKHVFCQDCVERWFADHNTCPNCRHVFQ